MGSSGLMIAAVSDGKKNLRNLHISEENSCLMIPRLCFEAEIPLALMVYMTANSEKLTWMKHGLRDFEVVREKQAWMKHDLEDFEVVREKRAGPLVKCVVVGLEPLRTFVVQGHVGKLLTLAAHMMAGEDSWMEHYTYLVVQV